MSINNNYYGVPHAPDSYRGQGVGLSATSPRAQSGAAGFSLLSLTRNSLLILNPSPKEKDFEPSPWERQGEEAVSPHFIWELLGSFGEFF